MEQLWAIIGTIFAIAVTIGAFLFWHFKTVNAFKDEIHRLDKKVDLQQQTIDKLSELYPVLNKVFEFLNNNNGK